MSIKRYTTRNGQVIEVGHWKKNQKKRDEQLGEGLRNIADAPQPEDDKTRTTKPEQQEEGQHNAR